MYLYQLHSHAGDSSDLKDRENKSLRRQLEGTAEDLAEAMRSRDVAVRENRRLQDDLTVMTRENQVSWGFFFQVCYIQRKADF